MATVPDAPKPGPLPWYYEVVNGAVVEMPPMSGFSSEVANRVRDVLTLYGLDERPAGLTRSDMMFRVPLPEDAERVRVPVAAFVSFERWPEDRGLPYTGSPVSVVPELAVEVVSPADGAEDVVAKAHDYLRAGVQLVWVVFPRLRQVYAYTHTVTPPRIFTDSDALDAGDVLPGFSVPMARLFPPLIVEKGKDDEDE
jgi:Uma2 family endonuclease